MENMIFSAIGNLLYPLFSIIFLVIDLLQGVFNALAGIGNVSFGGTPITAGNSGAEDDTGLIYYLLTSDLIKNLFLSILVLALILIIIFTAMAFIKNAYASKQKTWEEIVGNAFKGLANFIFIPVCCLLGVWLGNILLNAINGATSTGGATQMSRKLFICCAYDANQYRNGDKKISSPEDAEALEAWANENLKDETGKQLYTITVKSGEDAEYYAAIVDEVYSASVLLDIRTIKDVDYNYNLWEFNYLILIVGGVFMLYVLVSLAYAMIKRMFILLMLYVISPALCAMYPLDEGAAVGNWKKEFIKYTISAYGAVAGMNLFFSILPIVQKIELSQFGIANLIFQLLIMVSGLFVVKEFMSTLSGWIGGDDAMKSGESMRKQTKDAMNKYAKPVVNGSFGAIANTMGHQKSEGFFKGLWSGTKDSFLGKKNEKGDREGGLFNYMSGGTVDNVRKDLWRDTIQKEYKTGKDASEEDTRRKTAKDRKKDVKKNGWEEAEKVKNSIGEYIYEKNDDGTYKLDEKGQKVHEKYNNEERQYQFFQALKDVGLSDDEAYAEVQKKNGKTRAETIEDVKTGGKMTAAREKAEGEAKAQAQSSAANADLAEAIANALKSSPSGTESRVEETVRERAENKIQKQTNDLLEKLISIEQGAKDKAFESAANDLMKFNHGGDDSAFAKLIKEHLENNQPITTKQVVGNVQIDGDLDKFAGALARYNNALDSKKNAEQQAKEATEKFVEEMKKSADIEKILSKFSKTVEYSEEQMRELAKAVEDIAKKSK